MTRRIENGEFADGIWPERLQRPVGMCLDHLDVVKSVHARVSRAGSVRRSELRTRREEQIALRLAVLGYFKCDTYQKNVADRTFWLAPAMPLTDPLQLFLAEPEVPNDQSDFESRITSRSRAADAAERLSDEPNDQSDFESPITSHNGAADPVERLSDAFRKSCDLSAAHSENETSHSTDHEPPSVPSWRTKIFIALAALLFVGVVIWSGLFLLHKAKSTFVSWQQTRTAQIAIHARVAFDRGANLKKNGNYDGAVEAFREAVALKPDYAEALHELGDTLLKLQKPEEAIPFLNRALELRPDYADTLRDLGSAYLATQKWPEAVRVYENLTELEPKNATAYFEWGASLKANRKKVDSRRAFEKAISLRPNYPAAHAELGHLFLDLGDEDAAADKYLLLKSLDVGLANTLYDRFSLLQKTKIWWRLKVRRKLVNSGLF